LNASLFMLATALGVFGVLWPGGRSENKLSLLFLFFAIMPIYFYLTVISHYRYRFYVEPLMLVLASRGVHRLWTMLSRAAVLAPARRDSFQGTS
jgi:hypothetical protein